MGLLTPLSLKSVHLGPLHLIDNSQMIDASGLLEAISVDVSLVALPPELMAHGFINSSILEERSSWTPASDRQFTDDRCFGVTRSDFGGCVARCSTA